MGEGRGGRVGQGGGGMGMSRDREKKGPAQGLRGMGPGLGIKGQRVVFQDEKHGEGQRVWDPKEPQEKGETERERERGEGLGERERETRR